MNLNSNTTSFSLNKNEQLCRDRFLVLSGYKANFILSTIFGILVIASILGNSLTILTIQNGKRLLNVKANYFILALAYSDLISGLVGPIGIYLRTFGFFPFKWGHLTCNVYWMLEEMSCLTTSIHIATFAVYRFFSVCHPVEENRLTIKRIKVMLRIQWVMSFVCGFYVSFQWLGVRSGNKEEERHEGHLDFIDFINVFKKVQSNLNVIGRNGTSDPVAGTNDVGTNDDERIQPQDCGLKNHDDRGYVDIYIQMVYPLFYVFPMVLLIVTSTVICVSISKRAYLSRPKLLSTTSQDTGQDTEEVTEDVTEDATEVSEHDSKDYETLQVTPKPARKNKFTSKSPKPPRKKLSFLSISQTQSPILSSHQSHVPSPLPSIYHSSSFRVNSLSAKELHRLECLKNRTRTVIIQLSMVVLSYLIGCQGSAQN